MASQPPYLAALVTNDPLFTHVWHRRPRACTMPPAWTQVPSSPTRRSWPSGCPATSPSASPRRRATRTASLGSRSAAVAWGRCRGDTNAGPDLAAEATPWVTSSHVTHCRGIQQPVCLIGPMHAEVDAVRGCCCLRLITLQAYRCKPKCLLVLSARGCSGGRPELQPVPRQVVHASGPGEAVIDPQASFPSALLPLQTSSSDCWICSVAPQQWAMGSSRGPDNE